MSIFAAKISQIQDLVESPAERETLELKSWVDLSTADHVARAKCAKHLAAIANHGGGYLVFGFNKDGTRCARKNDVRTAYGHDVFAGIIEKYLHPKFQCDVLFPECQGVEHPVVWIPTHGMSPVIAKADGPKDPKGAVQGIHSGVVYIRTAKPESVPASTPEHWQKIIRRCVLASRDEMLALFSAVMSGVGSRESPPETTRKRLETWHVSAQHPARVAASIAEAKTRYPLAENFVQFSYMIAHSEEQRIAAKDAFLLVQKLNAAVRDTVRYGRSMFYPFTRKEIGPKFNSDAAIDGGDTDFLEANTFRGDSDRGEFWRIALDGRATIIRPFEEDTYEQSPPDIPEGGKWFDPRIHIRDIMEVVRHARAFAEEFENVSDICFQCEWFGLKGRRVTTHERYQSDIYIASTDWRRQYDCVAFGLVAADAPEVVARLFAPVYRVFNPRGDISAGYVRRYMDSFIVPGL
ncbi:MAG: hypothetical protein WB439_13770 [Acidobacteriaceae bacterium]